MATNASTSHAQTMDLVEEDKERMSLLLVFRWSKGLDEQQGMVLIVFLLWSHPIMPKRGLESNAMTTIVVTGT